MRRDKSSSASIVPNSLLFKVNRGHSRSTATTDSVPSRLVVVAQDDSTASPKNHEIEANRLDVSAGVCEVCRKCVSRYKCPRCEVPYCSVACYREHNNQDSHNGQTDDNIGSGYDSCTERFYHGRVSQVLNLEVQAKKDDTVKVLNRVYSLQQQGLQTRDFGTAAEAYSSSLDTNLPPEFPQEELYRLLDCLEKGDEEKISKLWLSDPRYQAAIERAVREDQLHEWIVDPWQPWWMSELSSSFAAAAAAADDDDDDEDEDASDDEASNVEASSSNDLVNEGSNTLTLDERLLKVAPFASLWPSSKDVPRFEFNVVDVLYAYVWNMRLYHGIFNSRNVALDAARSFIQSCECLANRRMLFESLEQTLSQRTAASTQAVKRSMCNTEWKVLVNDVALICQNSRFVARALLESIDLVDAARKLTKKTCQQNAQKEKMGFRQIKKKVQLYLSWSKDHGNVLSALSRDIDEWMSDWKLSESPDVVDLRLKPSKATRTSTIQVPVSTSTSRQDKAFSMRVISSTRINDSR